ncbi:prepilin-type N-terminal cleavage/methylation domain-containing protein [Polyangium sp. 15x6]|uniref:pilus assembly FimT family protein n=1 Tax=Polyangium sp. 15x6 TaxID=3042687 RepID=UPI0032B3E47B
MPRASAPLATCHAPARSRGRRGMTLVEVLITLAIMTLVTGTAVVGFGTLKRARLRQSSVMIASAVRVAYGHANAIGKPVRLVFDFEQRMVILEEGAGQLSVDKKDKTGGAAAATDIEQKAMEEAEKIVKGPRAPRPSFTPTKAFGFEPQGEKPGKDLADGVRFLSIDTSHQEEPIEEDRAYLYFWPGGQTERAAIQVVLGNPAEADPERDIMTVLVSPLTGKTSLQKGRVEMQRPRDESEESDARDSGF